MWFSSEGLRDEYIRDFQRQPAHLATTVQFEQSSQPGIHMPCTRAAPGRMMEDLMNEHASRSQRYHGNQQLRPDVPVSPQPTAEDIARRSRRFELRHDKSVRREPGSSRPGVTYLEDITPDLKHPSPWRGDAVSHTQCSYDDTDSSGHAHINEQHGEGNMDIRLTRDGSNDREQSLREEFEMMKYEDDLTADFEEVDRDIPTAFNGEPAR
ncbi:hypothetical protein GT037_003329 [Alternaria burnsii]|uniref:Uncharacterized protein n=1 Tax=Alternaria burnsii TaxID=1187904 RepID=A0A8H7B8P4_9PLEO|nr:uncharacterized protein GT037_003329 [Alternaria burnsii]KAF7679581.1 hypothetical protein GT037_003329 [Alternaria burnsii]